MTVITPYPTQVLRVTQEGHSAYCTFEEPPAHLREALWGLGAAGLGDGACVWGGVGGDVWMYVG